MAENWDFTTTRETRPPNRATGMTANENGTREPITSASPLLQLPAEVRLNIWKHLLGQRLIHISCPSRNRRKYCYTICQESVSEEDAQQNFLSSSRPSGEDPRPPWQRVACNHHYSERCYHEKCYRKLAFEEKFSSDNTEDRKSHPWRDRSEGEIKLARYLFLERPGRPFLTPSQRRPQLLHLDILRTCQALYREVTEVLYSTNTFSFAQPGALTLFLGHRKGSSRHFLRNLHLKIEISIHDADPNNDDSGMSYWFINDSKERKDRDMLTSQDYLSSLKASSSRDFELGKTWYTAMNADVVRKLRGLRRLHIHLEIKECEGSCTKCTELEVVESDTYKLWETTCPEKQEELQRIRSFRLCFLTKLSALTNLRTLTVMSYLSSPRTTYSRPGLRKLRRTSVWLRKAIARPDGRSVYFDKTIDKHINGKTLWNIRERVRKYKERSDRIQEEADLAYEAYCDQLNVYKFRHRGYEILHGADDFLTTNDKTCAWIVGVYESDESDEYERDGIIDLEPDDSHLGLEDTDDFPSDKHADSRNR